MYTKDDMTPPLIVEGIESWTLDRLTGYPGNARTHSPEQIAQIVASISEFGFVNPILVGSDGVIIAVTRDFSPPKSLA